MNGRTFKYAIAFLALVTLVPIAGIHLHGWSPQTLKTYYLAEGAILCVLIFLKYYAKHFIVFFVVLLMTGYELTVRDPEFWSGIIKPAATFWVIYSLCWPFYYDLGKTRLGLWIRSLHPAQHLAFYLGFMLFSILLAFSVTASVFHVWDQVGRITAREYAFIFAISALIPTVTICVLKIINMIGARHILNFLVGTYHSPVEKREVVLFLDLVGSSTIAEELTPKQSMELISRFIFDASASFRQHGGDIVNYTGDGLVVLWPEDKATDALKSAETLRNRLRNNRDMYRNTFRIVPEFRIGVHCGEVVLSQVGEERIFLGLYGDVVNTAARLEQYNKELGTQILFSGDFKSKIQGMDEDAFMEMGQQEILHGRIMELYTLKDWYDRYHKGEASRKSKRHGLHTRRRRLSSSES